MNNPTAKEQQAAEKLIHEITEAIWRKREQHVHHDYEEGQTEIDRDKLMYDTTEDFKAVDAFEKLTKVVIDEMASDLIEWKRGQVLTELGRTA